MILGGSGLQRRELLSWRTARTWRARQPLATIAGQKKSCEQRWASEHSWNQFSVSRFGRRAARRRQARCRRRGGAVQSHQTWQVTARRQPALTPRACDPFLLELRRAHRRRYRSRGILVRPPTAPNGISPRVVGGSAV